MWQKAFLRCQVVASTDGAFGYGVEDGGEIFGGHAEDFASACIGLLAEPRTSKYAFRVS